MYHITMVEAMHKVALLALVPRLRTVSSLQETTEEREMFTGETACLTRKNNLFLNARKQKKSKLSLSYMVHRIFWSESHRQVGWQTHSNTQHQSEAQAYSNTQ